VAKEERIAKRILKQLLTDSEARVPDKKKEETKEENRRKKNDRQLVK